MILFSSKYNLIAIKLSRRHNIATPNQFGAPFWLLNLVAVGHLVVMIFRLQLKLCDENSITKTHDYLALPMLPLFPITESYHPRLSRCHYLIRKSLVKQGQRPPRLARSLRSIVKNSLPTQARANTLT